MKQRLLAILAAVVLVAAGVVVRQRLAGDEGGSGSGSAHRGGTPVVACTPDLQPVCEALVADGVIEATAPVDLADAQDADTVAKLDGWLTWDPAPGVANFLHDQSGTQPPLWDPGEAVGSAGLSVAYASTVDPAKLPRTWAQLAASVNSPTLLQVGVGSASSSAGLTRLYPFTIDAAKDTDYKDLPAAPLRAIVNSPQNGQVADPLDSLITAGGTFDAVVAPVGAVRQAVALTTGRPTALLQRTPTPGASVVVTLAAPTDGGRSLDRVVSALKDGAPQQALTDVGLEPGGKLAPASRAGELYQVYVKVK